MVEIVPYTDDDDDDPSAWVPLHAPSSSAAASSSDDDGGSAGGGGRRRATHVHSDRSATDAVAPGDDGDDDDDEDGGFDGGKWRELPSPSARDARGAGPGTGDVAGELSSAWGEGLIRRITTVTASTTATEEEDEASEGDEGVVWRRANELVDEDCRALRGLGASGGGGSGGEGRAVFCVEEEYDDLAAVPHGRPGGVRPPTARAAVDDGRRGDREEGAPPQRPARPRREPTRDRPPRDPSGDPSDRRGRAAVERELRKKLIRDPLRALPGCFLRHFCREFKLRCRAAWESYRDRDEAARARLFLVVALAAAAVGLIGTGLSRLTSLALRASARLGGKTYGLAWALSQRLARTSMYATLILGTTFWIWSRRGGSATRKKPLQIPSTSALLAWIVAICSPPSLQALVVALSLRALASAMLFPSSLAEECPASYEGGAESTCLVTGALSVGTSKLLTACFAVSAVAAANAFVITTAANIAEQRNGGNDGRPGTIGLRDRLREILSGLQKHAIPCHGVGVASLGVLSGLVLLGKTLYLRWLEEGWALFFGLASEIKALGIGVACVATGVLALQVVWNKTTAIATADEGDASFSGISIEQISRAATKKSIVEISTNAVWTGGDVGCGLLGVLTEDDGALRVAILEWIVDHWTASASSPEAPEGKEGSHAEGGADAEEDVASPDRSCPGGSLNHGVNEDGANCDDDGNDDGDDDDGAANDFPSGDQSPLPSYRSLQTLIAKLDADETLLPTIERYRTWVHSLPPSRDVAMCVAIWKMCPATTALLLAAPWCVVRVLVGWLSLYISWCFGFFPENVLTPNGSGEWFLLSFAVVAMTMPVLYLEYCRVRSWWVKASGEVNHGERDALSSDDTPRGKLEFVLLRADAPYRPTESVHFNADVSSLLQRIYALLLESIALLESSVPVVRCATVASATADLTGDTVRLVGFALEVKKRGLIGGIGLLIWDAFNYHLSEEIERRYKESIDGADGKDCEGREEARRDLGGEGTGAALSAVEKIGKVSHNISCLIEPKRFDEAEEPCTKLPGQMADESGFSRDDDFTECSKASAKNIVEESESSRSESSECATSTKNTDGVALASCNQNPIDQISDRENKERSCEEDRLQGQTENGALIPMLIGGVTLVGAAAGMAMHAANRSGEQNNTLDANQRKKQNRG